MEPRLFIIHQRILWRINNSDWSENLKTVIMAGGAGTRISSVNAEVPKPMISILGKPVLEYQIEELKKQGFDDIIIVVGHLGSIIMDYFQKGQKLGVTISYYVETSPLGTAGALRHIVDELDDDFLLINGDIIFDVSLIKFYNFHKKCGGLASILVHPNTHPYDSGIIVTDENGNVKQWIHKEDKREWYQNRVNAGMHFLSKALFSESRFMLGKTYKEGKVDLDRDVLFPLVEKQELYAYYSVEYVKDMGTPDRYYEVENDITNHKVWSNENSKRAIFLDRDGTINEYVGFLTDINDFKLIDGVADSIRKINLSEYLTIVITNQPVVARGEVSVLELKQIHNKMETLLGEEHAYIDAIYYCPHHPNSGFLGEIKELKYDCTCRKPKPGMLIKAAKDYNIDLKRSWMIGDSLQDIQAGKAAGCHTAFISHDSSNEKYGQEVTGESLVYIISQII